MANEKKTFQQPQFRRSLDNTFGRGGIITLQLSDLDNADDVVIQPDGKAVVAGHQVSVEAFSVFFTLVRFNVDGSLDSAFGTGEVFSVPQTDTEQLLDSALAKSR